MEYGCIGEKLGHSFSKEIHNALADYDYCLKELKREELGDFFRNKEFKAINVTIPYKQDVIKYLDWISTEAKAINAVNTVVNKNGKLYGYNTDYYGLKALIEKNNISLKDKKVVILGSGGTSNTAFAIAKDMASREIYKVSRTAKTNCICYDELYEKHSDCDIVINTTPCGMYPRAGATAVDLSKMSNLEAVFDAVYNPLKSQLVLDAEKMGVTATGGLLMLVSQAAYAVEKFIETPVDAHKTEKVFQSIYKDKMNIVLIGMPTSGKTSVGKALSQKIGKTFADCDKAIEEREKRSIPKIFRQEGEAFFRNVEKNVVRDISMRNSQLISTGGGVILNYENIENLKSNGRIYFIDRPLEQLIAATDRPLSGTREDLEKRYRERYGLYNAIADVVVDGSGTVDDVAELIMEDFYEYSCD